MSETAQDSWQVTITNSIKILTRAQNRNSKELKRHGEVIDAFNGGIETIRTLNRITPRLVILAEYSERIISLAESKADDEAFFRGLKKRLNPLRPFGAALWALLLVSVSGIAVKILFH